MKRENERQIKKNLSKILGVLVLCLIMPLLFSISAEAKEAEESQQQEKVQQTERTKLIHLKIFLFLQWQVRHWITRDTGWS